MLYTLISLHATKTFHYRVSFQESIVLKRPNFRKCLVLANSLVISCMSLFVLIKLLDKGDIDDLGALHNFDFAMIKYPHTRQHSSLPCERVFTSDYDNQAS